MRARLLVAVLTVTFASSLLPARAEEPSAPAPSPAAAPQPPPAAVPAAAAVPDPGCDDEAAARKGVQKREFLKRRRLELTAWGGFFAADMVSTSYGFGGALSFFPFEDLGVEVSLVVTNFALSVEKPLTDIFGGQRFPSGFAYTVVGNLVWSPVHLKIRASEKAIMHGDLFFYLGAGDTIHDSVQGLTFDVGFGLKLYPTRWLALRFDLRDYLMVQEVVGSQRVVNNIVGLAGLSFFLPPGF